MQNFLPFFNYIKSLSFCILVATQADASMAVKVMEIKAALINLPYWLMMKDDSSSGLWAEGLDL